VLSYILLFHILSHFKTKSHRFQGIQWRSGSTWAVIQKGQRKQHRAIKAKQGVVLWWAKRTSKSAEDKNASIPWSLFLLCIDMKRTPYKQTLLNTQLFTIMFAFPQRAWHHSTRVYPRVWTAKPMLH